jgi:plasmid stabilization system protein ParE
VTRYDVRFLPEAFAQVEQIRAWWVEHRRSAPSLFDDELIAMIQRLAEAPEVGPTYQRRGERPLRRVLMPRTRYHAYYSVDADAAQVVIWTVWHATRGHGPPLT